MNSWSVEVEFNGVFIGLKDCSEKIISEFKENIIDHPALIFGESDIDVKPDIEKMNVPPLD
ncbi:hypothetical protein Barb6XT_03060 [Bacteroidales bacterium Barb6XT]|nr:hypothetical protein Barb6XT_03060 [Bacteroidales bacterium Barb6XT]